MDQNNKYAAFAAAAAALVPAATLNGTLYLADCETSEGRCLQTAPEQHHAPDEAPLYVLGTGTATHTGTRY